MIKETEIAYLAGLFDGEGYVSYKKYPKKRPNNKKPYQTWNIQMEVSMTDKSIIKLHCFFCAQSRNAINCNAFFVPSSEMR